MGLAFLTFLALFVLLGSVGYLIIQRNAVADRLSAAIATGPRRDILSWLRPGKPTESLKAMVQPFEKILPRSPREVGVVQKRLIRAGYRDDAALKVFYGAKVVVPVIVCVVATATGLSRNNEFFVYATGLALGFLAPDFWLGRRISKRQMNIRMALPDFLDLMVVCIDAGLSLDQAMLRTTAEMRHSKPEITDELQLLQLEQRAGRPREDAWKNLADRTDIDVVRALVSSINQADQFGTSISKTLRIYSDTLRTQRRQRVEEAANKMSVKLVFPLVFFIFPALFVVVLGPALIVLQDSLKTYFS